MVLAFVGPLLSILVAALILFSGLAAKLRDIATVLSRFGWVRLLVFFTLYTLIVYVVTFPLEWYQGYALEHYYGLSTQSFAAWIADEGKELLVSVVLLAVVPILWLAYRAIEKSPRRWWLWFAFATLPLVLGIALIEPLVIDPLFNKFTPLRDQQLKAKIIALAERAEIPGRKVYEVDKSKQTKTLNAYVNGFGVSQRIVLWDTTLHAMSDDEILYVMGHEMGHYKLAHIWKGIALSALGSFALLWIAARIARWAVRRFGDAWGFHELHDIASLPLLLAILLGLNFVSQPISNAVSRRIETEADALRPRDHPRQRRGGARVSQARRAEQVESRSAGLDPTDALHAPHLGRSRAPGARVPAVGAGQAEPLLPREIVEAAARRLRPASQTGARIRKAQSVITIFATLVIPSALNRAR